MKFIAGTTVLSFAGLMLLLAWEIGGSLSTDAVSMAIGLMFGAFVGIPALALVIAAKIYTEKEEKPTRPATFTVIQPYNRRQLR